MKVMQSSALIVMTLSVGFGADPVETFPSYIDSDLCGRLMLGPVTTARMECSQKTVKDGASPVVVRLKDNVIFDVNKTKMIKEYVGSLAMVTGETKVKDARMKLESVKSIDAASIPPGDPSRRVLDVRTYKIAGADAVREKIRHELAMMPYITEYDFLSFSMVGYDVILTGWTVRNTNRSTAENLVRSVQGVASVVNNIEVLPLGRNDMQIRAAARAALQRNLSRYFWGSGSDIKIIVKNGNIILLGTVATKADSDLATIRCNSVPMSFHVFNLLRVAADKEKAG